MLTFGQAHAQKVMLYFVVELLKQEKNRCGVLYLRDLIQTFMLKMFVMLTHLLWLVFEPSIFKTVK
jgi:hypothetical protein